MTSVPTYILAAVFGLLFGSFANVAALRAGDWKGILAGRSRCAHCRHNLAAADLVPVLSFAFLKGRCRYCAKPISRQYPIVELLGAGLAVLATWYASGNLAFAALLFLGLLFFLIVSVEDVLSQEVSLSYCVAAGALAGAAMWVSGRLPLLSVLAGALAGAGIVLAVSWLWKTARGMDGMGSGDAWISGAVGAAAGWPLIWVAFSFAVVSGAVIGSLLFGLSKKGLGSRLPFGPFLAAGLLFALVWGQAILRWYIL